MILTLPHSDPWHFRRTELAQSTLGLLSQKLAHALALFGPRRTGKTEFLLRDLRPCAEDAGHRVVYASFFVDGPAPSAILLHALETSRRSSTSWDRARTAVQALVPKIAVSTPLPLASGRAEVELASAPQTATADLALRLDELLGSLTNPKRPTILLLDEVQELGSTAANAAFIQTLRTGLDRYRDGLGAVFTGSSRSGLQRMFAAKEAPFFHFATPIELPQLDRAFVDHTLRVFQDVTGRALDRAAARAAFERLHHNPFHFRGLIELMLANRRLTVADALRIQRAQIAAQMGYQACWSGLATLERTALIVVAAGQTPTTRRVREAMRRSTGGPTPTVLQITNALRRLESAGLVEHWAGTWTMRDPELASWVCE
jgi:hypothetical protein